MMCSHTHWYLALFDSWYHPKNITLFTGYWNAVLIFTMMVLTWAAYPSDLFVLPPPPNLTLLLTHGVSNQLKMTILKRRHLTGGISNTLSHDLAAHSHQYSCNFYKYMYSHFHFNFHLEITFNVCSATIVHDFRPI